MNILRPANLDFRQDRPCTPFSLPFLSARSRRSEGLPDLQSGRVNERVKLLSSGYIYIYPHIKREGHDPERAGS